MAFSRGHSSHQSLQIAEITFEQGESVIVDFSAARGAAVDWVNGGVSWTINTNGTDFEMSVDHSLMPAGFNEDRHWTPDRNSPFDEPTEGNEHNRIQRLRFTADLGAPTVIICSNSKFEVVIL